MSTREWHASVGYRNTAGQTETTAGTGTTPDEALEDARQQPRLLATPTEIGYVLSSREVGEWQPEESVYHHLEDNRSAQLRR